MIFKIFFFFFNEPQPQPEPFVFVNMDLISHFRHSPNTHTLRPHLSLKSANAQRSLITNHYKEKRDGEGLAVVSDVTTVRLTITLAEVP